MNVFLSTSAMGFFLLSVFFFFSIFSLSINLSTPLPSLLSLNCTSDESNAHLHYNISPIKAILDNLTSEAPNSRLTTVSGLEQYTGLMQCRTGLSTKNCRICAETARNTILSHCKNSKAVSAWFDGCYVQISPTKSYSNVSGIFMNKIFIQSCSGRADNHDPNHFLPALETLLLKLRADITITTHHGFSHGEIQYENHINRSENKIYGLVECVRLLSPGECDACIAEAIDELYSYCSGENGGTVVYGQCIVRIDGSEFYRAEEDREMNVSARSITVWDGEINSGGSKKKVAMVMACWGGGASCFVFLVLSAWLLRRSVLNRAKVVPPDSADFNERA